MPKVLVSRSRSGLNIYMDDAVAMSLGGEGRKVALHYDVAGDVLYLRPQTGARNGIARHNNPQFKYRVTIPEDQGGAVIPTVNFGPTIIEVDENPLLPASLRGFSHAIKIQLPHLKDRAPARAEYKRSPAGRGTPSRQDPYSPPAVAKTPREQLRDTVAQLNKLLEQGYADGIQWDWVYMDQGPTGNADPVVKELRMPGKLRGRIAETFE